MRRVEQGKLDLDQPIVGILGEIASLHPDLTTRHLLNHAHGLANVVADQPGQVLAPNDEESKPTDWQLRTALAQPARFAAGTGWGYSPTGYVVLQAVLETAAGMSYEELTEQEIFEPLGLSSMQFGGSDRLVKGRLPMDYIHVDGRLSYNYLEYPRDGFASAGLNGTASDVAGFYRAVVDGQLLSTEARDEMWREVVLPSGDKTAYALGWGSFRTSRDGRWSIGHSGGGSSWTRYFPDEDIIVVVLGNLNGAREDKLVYDLATAVEQGRRFD